MPDRNRLSTARQGQPIEVSTLSPVPLKKPGLSASQNPDPVPAPASVPCESTPFTEVRERMPTPSLGPSFYDSQSQPKLSPLSRGVWIALGLLGCGLGGVGIVVPGMPATVFFIFAAFCFSRSSPRLLHWVLNLPRVGPLVRDYRAGLGMPKSAKIGALLTMAVCGGISLYTLSTLWVRLLVLGLLLVGACVVSFAVPTRRDTN